MISEQNVGRMRGKEIHSIILDKRNKKRKEERRVIQIHYHTLGNLLHFPRPCEFLATALKTALQGLLRRHFPYAHPRMKAKGWIWILPSLFLCLQSGLLTNGILCIFLISVLPVTIGVLEKMPIVEEILD